MAFFGVMPEGKAESFYGNNNMYAYFEMQWDLPETIPVGEELVHWGITVDEELWRLHQMTRRNARYLPKAKIKNFLQDRIEAWQRREKFYVYLNEDFRKFARVYAPDLFPLIATERALAGTAIAAAVAVANANAVVPFGVVPVDSVGAHGEAHPQVRGDIVHDLASVAAEKEEEMEDRRRSSVARLLLRTDSRSILDNMNANQGLKASNALSNGLQNYREYGCQYAEWAQGRAEGGAENLDEDLLVERIEYVVAAEPGSAAKPPGLGLLLLVAEGLIKSAFVMIHPSRSVTHYNPLIDTQTNAGSTPLFRRASAGVILRGALALSLSYFDVSLCKARDGPNRKRNETHETLLARARRCAPPRARWTAREPHRRNHPLSRDEPVRLCKHTDLHPLRQRSRTINLCLSLKPADTGALARLGTGQEGGANSQGRDQGANTQRGSLLYGIGQFVHKTNRYYQRVDAFLCLSDIRSRDLAVVEHRLRRSPRQLHRDECIYGR